MAIIKKPRLFIGSSEESIDIGDAITENLDHEIEVTIWRNGTFILSNTTIDSLVKKANEVDFAVFIFSPDDIASIRGTDKKVARDNVIFELGLFIGTIGPERCYIVKPRSSDLHLPTDLLGITTADFEPNRSDDDLASALVYPCLMIKKQVKKLGAFNDKSTITKRQRQAKSVLPEINEYDLALLFALVPSVTTNPRGLSLWSIKNDLNDESVKVDLASIKLEKLGMLEKRNSEDDHGEEYFTYTLTQDGLDYVLRNESMVLPKPRKPIAYDPDELPF